MIVHDIEQGGIEWRNLRLGLPTASGASNLVTSTASPSKSIERYAKDLASDLYAGESVSAWEGNKYTKRGHEIEPEARAWYCWKKSTDVQEVGFVTDALGRYGCSPDGMVGDDGLVEIKCLPIGHVAALMYWHKHRKPPPDYIPQNHMQMLVTDRAWCDLVYYHPKLPSIIIRVERSPTFDKALQHGITDCIMQRDRIHSILKELSLGGGSGSGSGDGGG